MPVFQNLGHAFDRTRLRLKADPARRQAEWPDGTRLLETASGRIRIRDTGGTGPALTFIPDAPNVIENYEELFGLLAADFRCVALELPGFGYSRPRPGFRFSLWENVEVVREVLDELGIAKATLAFTCVNGYVALAFAHRMPAKVDRLILSQTPSIAEMRRWARRNDLIDIAGHGILNTPIVGQLAMALFEKTIAQKWVRIALPKGFDVEPVLSPIMNVMRNGGAFCLAAPNQAYQSVTDGDLAVGGLPVAGVWGKMDRTHRPTDDHSLRAHAPDADITVCPDCGHCPDIEQPARHAELIRRLCG